MKYSAWWVLPIALSLSACAGIPREDGRVSVLERYMAYAGDPIDRFSYPQQLRGWHPIDREHLFIRTAPDTTYLLAVEGGCIGLMNTRSIGLTTNAGRAIVSSGLDEIRLQEDRCRIVEIRPLDYVRMRAEERAE